MNKKPENSTAESSPPQEKSLVDNFIATFTKEQNGDLAIPVKIKKESKNIQDALDNTRLIDNVIQIGLRIISSIFFGWLLGYQNIKVFGLVIDAIKNQTLPNLQLIFSVLVGATLFETYKIAEIMVKWLFKDINYK